MDSCLGLVDATWHIVKSNWSFSGWGCVIYERPGSHKEHGSDPQRVAIQPGSQCVRRRRKQSRRHIRGWAERLLGYGPYKLWVIVEGLKVVMWPWFLSASTSGSPFVRAFAQSYPIQIGKKCEEQVPVATFKRTSATMTCSLQSQHLQSPRAAGEVSVSMVLRRHHDLLQEAMKVRESDPESRWIKLIINPRYPQLSQVFLGRQKRTELYTLSSQGWKFNCCNSAASPRWWFKKQSPDLVCGSPPRYAATGVCCACRLRCPRGHMRKAMEKSDGSS